MARRPGTLTRASLLDRARAALSLAGAGVTAALCLHRAVVYFVLDPAIATGACAAAALQGGLLFASLRVWRVKVEPALASSAASALFTAAWAAPAYAGCVLLSIRLAAEVAGRALAVRDVATAPPVGTVRSGAGAGAGAGASAGGSSPPGRARLPADADAAAACPASPPGPAARAAGAAATAAAVAAGARPPRARSARAATPRPAAVAAGALFRSALMGALLGQAAAARALLPGKAGGGLVAGTVTALVYGWFAFDYAWVAAGLDLPSRLAALEAAWPFFAGFGGVAAAATILPSGLPPLEAGALTTALFPLFVVLAVDAGPGAGVVAAARATSAAAARGVALDPTTLPALRPAIAAAGAVVVRVVPAVVGAGRLAVAGWAAVARRKKGGPKGREVKKQL